jgi:hypothetical protein
MRGRSPAPRSLYPGPGWAILARSLVSCSRSWERSGCSSLTCHSRQLSPRHLRAPDKDPGVTVRGWLAGLSTSFGLGAAPWVCQPDGVIVSIWLGTPGHPGPLGLGLLGRVSLLSPRHPRTLGPLGPEVAVRQGCRKVKLSNIQGDFV